MDPITPICNACPDRRGTDEYSIIDDETGENTTFYICSNCGNNHPYLLKRFFTNTEIAEERFSDIFRSARKKLGLSLRGLEAKTGITATTLCNYETRRAYPKRLGLSKLCRVLKLDFETIEHVIANEKFPTLQGGLHRTQ